jgi:hypothetical protein
MLPACMTARAAGYKERKLANLAKSTMKLSGTKVQPIIRGPVFRPVEDVSYNERPEYIGSWVAEVRQPHAHTQGCCTRVPRVDTRDHCWTCVLPRTSMCTWSSGWVLTERSVCLLTDSVHFLCT